MNDAVHMGYRSVATHATYEKVIRKSRFIADIFAVQNEDETIAALEQVKKRHPEARHICYAYKHGVDGEVVRFSDAGEPAGTAGRPILEVLERSDLHCTLITVTRYFGGILLGAGGLVRAYASTAAGVVAAAEITRYEWHLACALTVDYSAWSRVERLLREAGYRYADVRYDVRVSCTCLVQPQALPGLTKLLQDATGGQTVIEPTPAGYHPV
ncbi:MAG TPA: DUF1949 domain-containing protein [Firmicutes bacterium]|jgi:uncharacterized YigZ family protein|nr:DUF1949 domain-containing protein [Bacillota bacterium]